MRETLFLKSKRRRATSITEVDEAVKKLYSPICREGSVCAWSWRHQGRIVAEAWPVQRSDDWWYKVVEKLEDGPFV